MSGNGSAGAAGRHEESIAPTVLLVEDEAALLKLTSRILRRRGYTVLEAATGADAIRIAAQHDGGIDLLLTDMNMPGIGGADVARDLVRTHPAIHIVFMSGYGEADLPAHGVAHTTHFLGKPFTPDGLLAKIEAVLG